MGTIYASVTATIGTVVEIIPGVFVYVNAGASLATITSLRGIVSPRVPGSFALLGLFALVPALYGRIRNNLEVQWKPAMTRQLGRSRYVGAVFVTDAGLKQRGHRGELR